jgi:short-subunit dehydrogenase
MRNRDKLIVGGIAAGTLVAGAAAGIGAVLAGRRVFQEFQGRRYRDLRGKVVLITGSSRGLGLALAEELARQGCNIILCAREQQELIRARQQVELLGAEVGAIPCDVSKPDDVERLINSARQQFGHIDILVNNAGVIAVGPLLAQRLEDFQEAMEIMFWGTVYPTLAVLPEMIERRSGSIVNITSIGGKVSVPHLLPYGCAKFAAVGFSEGLHAEVKKFGIHVLTVVPGLMRTGSHLNAYFKGKNQQEYGWFALSGTNPLLSISARRAARQIVNATRRRQAELIVSWQAELLAILNGVAPGVVAEAMGLVNRLLPDAPGQPTEKKRGSESQSAVTRSALTALGQSAARRYNQFQETA